MFDKFDVIVVSTENRKSLITKHLSGIDHIISITPNYSLPEGFEPSVKGLTHNHLGTYRCFKGHQDAIAKATKDCVLIFEDDAVPDRADWFSVIRETTFLLHAFDVISYHGRAYNKECFEKVNVSPIHKFIRPKNSDTWIVAALAYLISKKDYEKAKSFVYDGTPWDLVLYRNFNYCLMENSPFVHDRSEGSLVD